MKKALKTKWVKALRSGKYKQGRGALLKDDGTLCCLGVFGRVVGVSNEMLRAHSHNLALEDSNGVDALDPIGSLDVRNTLSDMNDKGKTFAQIARYIEKNL